MAICSECGFVVREKRTKCDKCGATLRPPALQVASRQAVRSLAAALREAEAAAAREESPEGPAATPPARQARRSPAALPAPRPDRFWARTMASLLALVLLAFLGKVMFDRSGIPFAEGDTWTFEVLGRPGMNITASVGAEARGGRAVRVDLVDDGAPSSLGVAFVRKGFWGVYVLGLQQVGSGEPELESVRILPFPVGGGSAWTERVGGGWGSPPFRLRFQVGEDRVVVTRDATFQALPVKFDLAAPVGPPLLHGSYDVARGVGPVQFYLDVPGEFRGLREIHLRLVRFERG